MQKYFVKIDRIAAWILLTAVIIYVISGFGMTKGIIDYKLASSLHLGWIGALGMAAFAIHTFWAIHLSLMRHKIWNIWTKILLSLAYAFVIIAVIYLAVFYEAASPQADNGAGSSSVAQGMETLTVFSASELAKYDGMNGRPAYVAVDGKVYDLSSVYRNGDHKGHKAGLDLTGAFYSFHKAEILSKFKVVGAFSAGN